MPLYDRRHPPAALRGPENKRKEKKEQMTAGAVWAVVVREAGPSCTSASRTPSRTRKRSTSSTETGGIPTETPGGPGWTISVCN